MRTDPPGCPCRRSWCADADGDGDVGLTDLAILLVQFGSTGPGLSADLDGDEDVDLSDLAILLMQFGSSC